MADATKQSVEQSKPNGSGATKPAENLPKSAPTGVQNSEPEDAYLTGGQRNLQRRVLGLNVEGPAAGSSQRPAGQSPGVHSTGSFTGTADRDSAPDKTPAKEG